jgi:hypothetical protein
MIDIPDFRAGHLDLSRFDGDIGAAFQAFVGELLVAEGIDAHAFPAAGKDGGIDLVEELEGGGIRGLASPEGPPVGQGQYHPWYDPERRIRAYTFCPSSALANEEQRRTLLRAITATWDELVQKYPHLGHLRDIAIDLYDWQDARTRLSRQEHLLYRWFPDRSSPRSAGNFGGGRGL